MKATTVTLFIVGAVSLFLAVLIPVSNAQAKIEITGAIEIPHKECLEGKQDMILDAANKTICVCLRIMNVFATWNCMHADGYPEFADLTQFFNTVKGLSATFAAKGAAKPKREAAQMASW